MGGARSCAIRVQAESPLLCPRVQTRQIAEGYAGYNMTMCACELDFSSLYPYCSRLICNPHRARNLDQVFALFPRLKERATQKAGTLSGGEQQMLAVARGLMAQPEVLMFDELSLGLSPLLVLQLFDTLRQLKAAGLTMLLVEQNVHMALAVSDYAYVLNEGKVWTEGPAREVARNPQVRQAYLGI